MSCQYRITFEAFIEAQQDGALAEAAILLVELHEIVQENDRLRLDRSKELRAG